MANTRLLIELSEDLLRGFKGATRFLEMGPSWLKYSGYKSIIEHWDALTLAFFLLILSLFAWGALALAHVSFSVIRRRKSSIFLSYQHDEEVFVKYIETALLRANFLVNKLPFVEYPEHDALLDQVNLGIRKCDLFVCIPGRNPSFVENEVSMAFALGKPLFFIIDDREAPRLPNTAKKGYPIFSRGSLSTGNIKTFLKLCSYVTSDWRSTVEIYTAALERVGESLSLILVMFIIAATLITMEIGHLPIREYSKPLEILYTWITVSSSSRIALSFVMFGLFVFSSPFLISSLFRLLIRNRVKNAITGKKFVDETLPQILERSLSKENVAAIYYTGPMFAAHEVATGALSMDDINAAGTSSVFNPQYSGVRSKILAFSVRIRRYLRSGPALASYVAAAIVGFAIVVPPSLATMARCQGYFDRGDYIIASWECKAAAKDGIGDAANTVGFMLDHGYGGDVDLKAAFKWFQTAAQLGSSIGMSNVGVYYENGQTVSQDFVLAMKWYEASAAKGNGSAMYHIGQLYERGRGVKRDAAKAFDWYMDAAAAGSEESLRHVGLIGVRIDLIDGMFKFVDVSPDGPAARAGLRVGDTLIAIDGWAPVGSSVKDVLRKIRGRPSSRVIVSINRSGEPQPLSLPVTREIL